MDPFELVGSDFVLVYFESNPVCEYDSDLDDKLDQVAEIVDYDYSNDVYHVKINNQIFEYPAYVVQDQFNDKAMQALKTILKN